MLMVSRLQMCPGGRNSPHGRDLAWMLGTGCRMTGHGTRNDLNSLGIVEQTVGTFA